MKKFMKSYKSSIILIMAVIIGTIIGLIFKEKANVLSPLGDIFINMKNMLAGQAEYNRYAPILMTSVDTDPELCARERKAIFARLGAGTWQIFGGHGGRKVYTVKPTD